MQRAESADFAERRAYKGQIIVANAIIRVSKTFGAKNIGPLQERPSTTSYTHRELQRGLDFKAPGFEQRLRDVLRILVAACPLPQTSRPQILVGGEFVLAHNLLKFGDSRGNWADRLRLAPVRISASLGHEKLPFHLKGDELLLHANMANYMIPYSIPRIHSETRPPLDN